MDESYSMIHEGTPTAMRCAPDRTISTRREITIQWRKWKYVGPNPITHQHQMTISNGELIQTIYWRSMSYIKSEFADMKDLRGLNVRLIQNNNDTDIKVSWGDVCVTDGSSVAIQISHAHSLANVVFSGIIFLYK